ncbi:MAG: peptide chain release factor N(5)-glutamine methyltransferase [Sphingobium sp.]
MRKAADALREAATVLAEVSETARLDAELLMAHALGLSRGELILTLGDLAEPPEFVALVERRRAHEPVSHITGKRDFWTLTLAVTPDVLTPRPDSETLIEAAIDHFRDRPAPQRILDLGTGSGALLLAALDVWPDASGLGVDISPPALDVARRNAHLCGMAHRAAFRAGDWLLGLEETFDLILANPPYIAVHAKLPPDVADHEPALALFAGEDGLDAYRAIAPELERIMAPGGFTAVEIGFDQAETAALLFRQRGLTVEIKADLAGHPRCLMVRR